MTEPDQPSARPAKVRREIEVDSPDEAPALPAKKVAPGKSAVVTTTAAAKATPRKKPVAIAHPVMPTSEDAVLNNLLCRELADPTDYQEPPDPSLVVMDRVARAMLGGEDINRDSPAVQKLVAYLLEKSELYTALQVAHNLHELNEWTQTNAIAQKELRKLARRGDLKSYEYLALLRLGEGRAKMLKEELSNVHPVDATTLIHRLDSGKQLSELKIEQKYRGTTPQGREIIRKQIFLFKQKLQEAGKLKET